MPDAKFNATMDFFKGYMIAVIPRAGTSRRTRFVLLLLRSDGFAELAPAAMLAGRRSIDTSAG